MAQVDDQKEREAQMAREKEIELAGHAIMSSLRAFFEGRASLMVGELKVRFVRDGKPAAKGQ
jgi:hypothetical protein